MLEFLPQNVKNAIGKLNLSYLYEIRLRADRPTAINYQGKYYYLGEYGITVHKEKALYCNMEDISDCVFKAGKYSVYSVEEQLKQGFVTAESGERIGIAGEYVYDKGQPLALRRFTSLCIRVPHEVRGCGEEIYKFCMSDRVRSLLLMSSPGLGKTTILRDLGRIISEKTGKNLLICDERGEISLGNMGESWDILRYSDKERAFEAGIRALRPDVILTDELSKKDSSAIEKAFASGICVIATAHFSSMSRVDASLKGLFERYVLLEEGEIGKVKAIFNKNGEEII